MQGSVSGAAVEAAEYPGVHVERPQPAEEEQPSLGRESRSLT